LRIIDTKRDRGRRRKSRPGASQRVRAGFLWDRSLANSNRQNSSTEPQPSFSTVSPSSRRMSGQGLGSRRDDCRNRTLRQTGSFLTFRASITEFRRWKKWPTKQSPARKEAWRNARPVSARALWSQSPFIRVPHHAV